jgi:hypothetical protein
MANSDRASRKQKAWIKAYENVIFNSSPSTGRPGSPHRYFNDSYTVSFDCQNSSAGNTAIDKSADPDCAPNQTSNENAHQVVHRHLNGLFIVTAGNVLEQFTNCNATDSNDETVSVSSIKYHVRISQNAQSARGKLRAKKRKRKDSNKPSAKNDNNITNPDGAVEANDTLCTVTLSNGMEYALKCCVAGTIIELNSRLARANNDDFLVTNMQSPTNDTALGEQNDGTGVLNNDADCEVAGIIDPSLLLTDPLLDGYLAVVLPRGGFMNEE